MSKKILIDGSNSDQTRIAVTEDDKLEDFEIESNKKNSVKGDVYLAKITRVEPSLQAAFIDFGTNRNGFLPLTEIHPDYFKIPSADQKEVKKLYQKFLDQDEGIDTNTKDQQKNEQEEKDENEIDEKDELEEQNEELKGERILSEETVMIVNDTNLFIENQGISDNKIIYYPALLVFLFITGSVLIRTYNYLDELEGKM